jgi:hypothetical protein
VGRSQLILLPASPPSAEELRRRYIATLIDLLREMGNRCEVDAPLAERIARLLGLASTTNG